MKFQISLIQTVIINFMSIVIKWMVFLKIPHQIGLNLTGHHPIVYRNQFRCLNFLKLINFKEQLTIFIVSQ